MLREMETIKLIQKAFGKDLTLLAFPVDATKKLYLLCKDSLFGDPKKYYIKHICTLYINELQIRSTD